MKQRWQHTWVDRAQGLAKHLAVSMARLWRSRLILGAVLVALVLVAITASTISIALAPRYKATSSVPLAAVQMPDVALRIVYPSSLGPEQDGERAAITVWARAARPEAAHPVELALSAPDGTIAFVDELGRHTAGRLTVQPGYPDALPYDLWPVHQDVRLEGRGPWPRFAPVRVLVQGDKGAVPVPELAFRIRLQSRAAQVWSRFTTAVAAYAIPLFVLGVVMLAVAWVAHQIGRHRRLAEERRLADLYGALRQAIKLERWKEAREAVERIRAIRPHYRDVDRLDTMVTAAETAHWRREQLYEAGMRAYRQRDWPSAVQAFAAIEQETPYYRDVRFLRRTAALYADLKSRDRSLRLAAAQQLGEVADLIDMYPLLEVLADPSSQVAEAAMASFARIGLQAFDALLHGLIHPTSAVRERAYSLLERFGQDARPHLIAALRSADPRITRAVSRLLARLGARQELAEALLWAAPEHLEGIVQGLLSEGVAARDALVQALLRASRDRERVVLGAIAALKMQGDLDRYFEGLARSERDPARKTKLERAAKIEAGAFHWGEAPSAPETMLDSDSLNKPPRLRLLRR